jgi:hypothetical protein
MKRLTRTTSRPSGPAPFPVFAVRELLDAVLERAGDDRGVTARDVRTVTCVPAGALGCALAAGLCVLAAGMRALAAADGTRAAAETGSCPGELVSANPATALDATITASAADPVSTIAAGPRDRRGRAAPAPTGAAGTVPTRRSIRSAWAASRRLSGSLRSSPLITGHSSGPA